jgi:adenylate kinase
VICNKFVWLQCDDKVAKARFTSAAKFASLNVTPEEVDDKYTQFHRHIKTFADRFQDVRGSVDTNRPVEAVWDELRAFLEKAPVSKAPRRPMRVLMLGPTGAGKATQCNRLARKYGLIHISTGDLLRKEAAKSETFAAQVQTFVDAGALVPDDLVSSVVCQRLLQTDCRERGWVLDGFPRTTNQADALAKHSLEANRCIVLAVSDEKCLERITQRRIDPATGDIYFLNEQEAPKSVAGRLITQDKDQATNARTLIMEYQQSSEQLSLHYTKILKEFDGTQDVDAIGEQIEHFLFAALGSGRKLA